MFRLLVFIFISRLASCLTKPKIIDPNIKISIEDAQSYKYNLANQTYTVNRIFHPDTTIHFELTAKEREEIINKYYDLELNVLEGKQRIEDECMIMPKLYTTLEVKSQRGLQEIMIDEGCNDFKSSFTNQGKKIQMFLKFVEKILKDKPEIINAPKSDIIYL